jgi:glycerol-3-phosphate dehydrogenase
VVVGAGVVGSAIAMELARRGYEPLLLEQGFDVGEGASKSNSAIVHTGFDARPGSIEATLLARARPLWPAIVEELGVPFLRIGALMLGAHPGDLARLRSEMVPLARSNGVPVEILDGADVARLAPWAMPDASGALLVPDESIVDPFWLTRAYAEAAIGSGGSVRLGAEVVGLSLARGAVVAQLRDGATVVADQVVNCAGLMADAIASLAGDGSFTISPRKGEFLVSEEAFGIDRIALPIPGPMGKGMLLTPIIFGGLLLGPTAHDQLDKRDHSTHRDTREVILHACAGLAPSVAEARPIRAFAGLRTVSSTGDYILRASAVSDRLHHAAGIRSTGISASPAIAQFVADQVERARGWRPAPRPRRLEPRQLDAASGGAVVCLCRSIGAAEVAAASRTAVPVTTLDGLKRRCGVTFGDCQGNLCAVAAVAALANASGVPVTAVTRRGPGSWLFGAPADGWRPAVARHERPRAVPPPSTEADLIVVGAGLAGVGAALTAGHSGRRVLVVERLDRAGGAAVGYGLRLGRSERDALQAFETAGAAAGIGFLGSTTVTGLLPSPDGWVVLGQGESGTIELRASSIVLATGGYVEPAEHLGLDGPRPAGIVTADLVHQALAAGLLPGRQAVLVGDGRSADATWRALVAAGCDVVSMTTRTPDEVRGDTRLESVRFGDAWTDADTLVLCHRLLPQPFLLRGLGSLDARPGCPAPVDQDGRVADGLWAAGTCAAPDVDHRTSLADGSRVASRSIESLRAGA